MKVYDFRIVLKENKAYSRASVHTMLETTEQRALDRVIVKQYGMGARFEQEIGRDDSGKGNVHGRVVKTGDDLADVRCLIPQLIVRITREGL